MVLGKKIVIYDLDDTLYNKTSEFAEILDTTMAEALVYDLGLNMNVNEAKELVTLSYKIYRDGGEIFYRDYGINPQDLFIAYHKRKPVEKIIPYDNLLDKIKKVDAEQYIFTASDRYASEKILKHLGLYEFFKDRYYSVEDFGVFKKNESADVYGYNIRKDGSDTVFTVRTTDFDRDFTLTIPGLFNVENALCAIAVCCKLGIPEKFIYTTSFFSIIAPFFCYGNV